MEGIAMTKDIYDRNQVADVQGIIDQLLRSENVCDERKGSDLKQLVQLMEGRWAGRFNILRTAGTLERSLLIVCRLGVSGLIWAGNRPIPNDDFVCTAAIPNYYPLSQPDVRFIGKIPWCCHVVHKDFLPNTTELPADLHEYLRQGDGNCCYMRSSQWSPSATLALVFWQVSRLLTFGKSQGEAGSLNPAARDHMLRLTRQGDQLPLGDPLPYPYDDSMEDSQKISVEPACVNDDEADEDVEWIPGTGAVSDES